MTIAEQDIIDLSRSIEVMFGKAPQGLENLNPEKVQAWLDHIRPLAQTPEHLQQALQHYIEGQGKWAPTLAQMIKSLRATRSRQQGAHKMSAEDEMRWRASQATDGRVWAIQLADNGKPHLKLVSNERAVRYQGKWWLVEDAANEVFGGKDVTRMYQEALAEIAGVGADVPPMTAWKLAQKMPGYEQKLSKFRNTLKNLIEQRGNKHPLP